jgi:hypothetical protein
MHFVNLKRILIMVLNGGMLVTINSKQKGKRGELEFSNLCKSHGYKTKRTQQYCGSNGNADVDGINGVHIEVKRNENLNVSKAIAQAESDAREGEIPIVAHRKNNEQWLITMKADDWFKVFEKYYKYEE